MVPVPRGMVPGAFTSYWVEFRMVMRFLFIWVIFFLLL